MTRRGSQGSPGLGYREPRLPGALRLLPGLLFGYRFRIEARWRDGVVTERIIRVRGFGMGRTWEKLLRAPKHPETVIVAIGPVSRG